MTSIIKVFEATIPELDEDTLAISCHNTEVEYDDGGQALIVGIYDGGEAGFCVELRSWDETKEHEQLRSIMGKTVRVTVEVID